MLCAVIPVQNEALRLNEVLHNILALPLDFVLPVVNGSRDGSPEIIGSFPQKDRIRQIHFEKPLGIDVPRAVGALHAHRMGADVVLFVDGDMAGDIRLVLKKLLQSVQNGVDLSLVDCYPALDHEVATPVVNELVALRKLLNRSLGLTGLGTASPSHGPHAVSRRLLDSAPFRELAVPPVALVRAARKGLKVGVAASIPHCELGSPDRGPHHARLIAETIIGDHLEAFCVLNNRTRSRIRDGVTFNGYHHTRRWDLLEAEISGVTGRKAGGTTERHP